MHIDMNSYFASVEQQANPFLRGKPVGITGKQETRSIVAAASIEAKKLGVKTAMSTWEAKQICPSIILYPGDPEKYSHLKNKFNALFREYTDRVEQFSVDESFLDVTDEAKDYLGATFLAQMIRERLKVICGQYITASIGIAPNKLMAKLCSGQVKPNGLTVVQPHNVESHLDRSDLQDVCGIGSRTAQHLQALGIQTFVQLRAFSKEDLVKEFKSLGFWLYDAARGQDHDPVCPNIAPPKSVGHSYTLPSDTEDPNEMKRNLLGLCDKVAWRLRRDGFVARRIHVHVRYGDFSGMGQQLKLGNPIANGLIIFKTAWHLIEKWRDEMKPVRLLGISVSDLSVGSEQPSLFKKERSTQRLFSALDVLQTRYGSNVWMRASLLHTKFKARSSGFHFDHEL